jgi:hypothetical protein
LHAFVITALDAVRTNETKASPNNKTIEDKIKSWLSQARDRDGGRKRRFEIPMLQHSLVDHKIEETQHCRVVEEQGYLRLTTNEEQLSMIPHGSSTFHQNQPSIPLPMIAYLHSQQLNAQNIYGYMLLS